MGRRKKSKESKSKYGWDTSEAEEAKVAEGLKRSQLDEGKVSIVDRDLSTPVIETYDADTGALEGSILLKDGNREGLLGLVKIVETVDTELDHDSNIESMNFQGKLNVENPSKVDRIWDIDVELKNIEKTNLKTNKIKIQELGTDEDTKVETHEFLIKDEVPNLILVKEYVNTLPNADDVLNSRDIENDLLKLKDKTSKVGSKVKNHEEEKEVVEVKEEDEEEEEEDDDTYSDGGTSDLTLESFGISIDKENVVWFAIGLRSMYEKAITNVKVVKELPYEFKDSMIRSTSVGSADVEGDKVVWKIERLEPERTAVLKFTSNITVSDITARKTGPVTLTYEGTSSFAGGFDIEKYDAYTRNKFYVDVVERDEEPGVWDCKLVFENASEFIIQLFNADVYSPEDENVKYIDIDPKDVPLLPAGAQWHSTKWRYESEDYPSFRKKLEFRVMPDFQTAVKGYVAISDVILEIASITGDMSYDIEQVPTYKEKDIFASLKIINNGSAPLNEVSVTQQFFDKEFQPPKADEIKLVWDDNELELGADAVSFDGSVFKVSLNDLRNSKTGMFEPESTLKFEYPIHCISPVQDAKFESEIIYRANTYPMSQELEFKPFVPVVEALHLRRKFRIGKEVEPIGELGTYRIILSIENIGTAILQNLVLMDKVPDSFEYGSYSQKPKITDEVGSDTLKWTIEKLEAGERVEITYEINGTGEYSPSDAQLGL